MDFKSKDIKRVQIHTKKFNKNIYFQFSILPSKFSKNGNIAAETEYLDPYFSKIRFVVRDARDVKELVFKFCQQFRYKGFIPQRYRVFFASKNTWSEWMEI